ncbi:BQ2448_1836 [Microbotryum intermedium]|uniref:BQ2448_1836 protein n=1 Tax=Microbotryum intermedium TaxID=269621 RepID=A0A238F995_9BASI|nr:BQ2448_1836 [Microbotryum intermedium]
MNIPATTTFHTTTSEQQLSPVALADSSADVDEPPIKGSLPQFNTPNSSSSNQDHPNANTTPAPTTLIGVNGEQQHPPLYARLRGRLLYSQSTPERSASVPNLRIVSSDGSDPQVTPGVARTNTSLTAAAAHSTAPLYKSATSAQAQANANATTGAGRPIPFTEVLLTPKKPVGAPPGWKLSFFNILRYSYLNILLVFIPIAWAMDFSHQSAVVCFFTSFAAIVPLAALLGFATEELALRVGDALGGLLNASFGNATELIISILALVKGELRVVQSSMLGSILSNCLLVLGMCFFAGGLRFHEQGYESRSANLNINLLGVAISSIIIPVGFVSFVTSDNLLDAATAARDVMSISRAVAILLLITYIGYMLFQLWTHSYLFVPVVLEPGEKRRPIAAYIEGPQPPTEGGVFRIPSLPSWGGSSSSASSVLSRVDTNSSEQDAEAQSMQDKDHNTPRLSVIFALLLLLVVTGLTGYTAEILVGSIDGLVSTTSLNREFVALILLPLVGNAAEHITAVTVASKGKLDLAMSVAVGSSIQIALFVIPLLVLIGWMIGQPLTLAFDPFETLILFLSICAVNFAIQDGRSNWLEGGTLMMAYVVIAIVAFYYPGTPI